MFQIHVIVVRDLIIVVQCNSTGAKVDVEVLGISSLSCYSHHYMQQLQMVIQLWWSCF